MQTVDRDRFPRFHQSLQAFDDLTGCPVLLNTSFNVRGEPIVCTADDAYDCFRRTDIDALVVDDVLLLREEQNGVRAVAAHVPVAARPTVGITS